MFLSSYSRATCSIKITEACDGQAGTQACQWSHIHPPCEHYISCAKLITAISSLNMQPLVNKEYEYRHIQTRFVAHLDPHNGWFRPLLWLLWTFPNDFAVQEETFLWCWYNQLPGQDEHCAVHRLQKNSDRTSPGYQLQLVWWLGTPIMWKRRR